MLNNSYEKKISVIHQFEEKAMQIFLSKNNWGVPTWGIPTRVFIKLFNYQVLEILQGDVTSWLITSYYVIFKWENGIMNYWKPPQNWNYYSFHKITVHTVIHLHVFFVINV